MTIIRAQFAPWQIKFARHMQAIETIPKPNPRNPLAVGWTAMRVFYHSTRASAILSGVKGKPCSP